MKVLYIITVRGHGSGGHFHSLNHISQAMGEEIDVGICAYGTGKSEVLENNPHFKKHIHFKGFNFLTLIFQLKNLLKEFQPDLIHCFDTTAYNIFTLFFSQNKYSIFLNKCGGPNPESFPVVKNLILFSEENKNWFKKRPEFKDINIAVIPNRVNPKVLNFDFKKPVKKENAFCFVRIARIGSAYKKSIEDSIRLVGHLKEKGLNVHLYIIGAIQDNKIAEELKGKIYGLPITMLNQKQYTAKASDMLYLADAVIATGRGIMEGTSLGKPILTPASNSVYPVLVSSSNFDSFFKTNFSERNIASQESLKENMSRITSMLENQYEYEKLALFSKNSFDKNFSTETGIPQYLKFYRINSNSKKIKFNLFTNLEFKLKAIYSFLK
ncbi:MAG: glycosyltransferase family 4 protein [Flavobacteriaceae bacterium]